MHDLPRSARIYVASVILTGLAVIAWRLGAGSAHGDVLFLTLLSFCAVLGSRTVSLGQKVEMSVSLPLILCALIEIGPTAAMDIAVVGVTSSCLIRRKPLPLHRTLFNVTSVVLVTALSSWVYTVSLPAGQEFTPAFYFIPLVLTVVTYFIVNTCLVAGVVSLASGRPFPRVWKESFLWTIVSYLAGGSVAVGLVHLLAWFGPYSLLLAIPPLVLIYYFFRFYADRAAERRRHVEEIERHNAQLESEVARRTQDLVELNERLRESNEQLTDANRLKSEFLANMSHELRTPLNAIIGFSELLGEGTYGALNDEQRSSVHDIHASGTHLLALINDILDLSKIEAGRMVLHVAECELGDIVQESLTVVSPLAIRKRLSLEARSDPDPLRVRIDAGKIKQVLYNLLSNAVKFTPDGGCVDVVARADGLELVVSVSDTGIGIAETDIEQIFDQFFQVDGSYTRRHEGTGLGLALVRSLVEMHGGTISVASRPGEGSTFTFRIPGAVVAATVTDDAPEASLSARGAAQAGSAARGTILLVEDNPVNMKLTRSILSSQGFDVVEARTADEALVVVRRGRPDLILMDLQLPGEDGLTLTRRMKLDPETRGIPTVALTACAMSGDEDRAREAGCVGYITKPVSAAQLIGQVSALLSGRP